MIQQPWLLQNPKNDFNELWLVIIILICIAILYFGGVI